MCLVQLADCVFYMPSLQRKHSGSELHSVGKTTVELPLKKRTQIGEGWIYNLNGMRLVLLTNNLKVYKTRCHVILKSKCRDVRWEPAACVEVGIRSHC